MSANSLGLLHSDFNRIPVRTPQQTRGDIYAHVLGAWRQSRRTSVRARYVVALLERLVELVDLDYKHSDLLAERQRIETELDGYGAIVHGYDMRLYRSLGSDAYFDGVLSRIEGRGLHMRAERISGNVKVILDRLAG